MFKFQNKKSKTYENAHRSTKCDVTVLIIEKIIDLLIKNSDLKTVEKFRNWAFENLAIHRMKKRMLKCKIIAEIYLNSRSHKIRKKAADYAEHNFPITRPKNESMKTFMEMFI